jgi:uncharacterized protein (TIGR02172 family)
MDEMELGNMIGRGRTAKIYRYGDNDVVKLFEKNFDSKAVEHEYSSSKIVHESGLAVPYVKEMMELEGQYGIVYEYVSGPTMMKLMQSKPYLIGRLARKLAELQVSMHKKTASSLPDIKEKFKTMINRINTLPDDKVKKILNVLNSLPDGDSICHMDFHPDNIIKSNDRYVTIDWTNAAKGSPAADVALTSLTISMGAMPPGTPKIVLYVTELMRKKLHSEYLNEYLRLSDISMDEIVPWELMAAALRLSYNIPVEQKYLIKRIDSLLECV